MEKSSQYHYIVEPFSEDVSGQLSWGNLGNILLRCASLHAGEHGFGFKQMIAIHHAWVLSRLVIEVEAMPRTAEPFTIETWVDRVYRQFTDRHFSILRPDGSAYGHATSTWSLIHTESRQPADLTKLPDGGFTSTLIPERPSPIAPMGRLRPTKLERVKSHQAVYTDLDINGHVNSIRYLELLLNTYEPHYLNAHPVRRIEMAYSLEAHFGDTLHIYKEQDPQDSRRVLFEIRKGDDDVVVVKAGIKVQ